MSPSLDQQAVNRVAEVVSRADWERAGIALCEQVDGMAALRNGLRRVAAKLDHWAGIPMPLEDLPLTIEPRYPNAAELMALCRPPPNGGDQAEADDAAGDGKIRNRFYSKARRAEIVIWEKGGKIHWGYGSRGTQTGFLLSTLGAADAWGIEQEGRAVQMLAGMLRHRQFKQYMMTGSFLESSRRSGVCYMFRRLRPTLALSLRGKHPRVLAALCLHPIGYYEGSWAGAMCPTDEVVAHLSLMRGDEAMFWRRSNQHPAWEMSAGVS